MDKPNGTVNNENSVNGKYTDEKPRQNRPTTGEKYGCVSQSSLF